MGDKKSETKAITNGGQWAQPTSDELDGGLSIREWFVGQALAGSARFSVETGADIEELADAACKIADAALLRAEQTRRTVSRCYICREVYEGEVCPECSQQGVDLGDDDPTGEPHQDLTPGDERLIPRPHGAKDPPFHRPPRPAGGGG